MGGRYLKSQIVKHLQTLRQMVFLTGPRQVGKTTLAQSLLSTPISGTNYFNWDVAAHRKVITTKILTGDMLLDGADQSVLVFDEIHKYPRWKNAIKGLFDTHEPNTHWIVTGSAMLNVYRRGQDSLLGRHFTYHLAPFSVAEMIGSSGKVVKPDELILAAYSAPSPESVDAFEQLTRFGGFPEPLFRGEESFLSRWRRSRLERLLNQDLASTEMLRQLPLVEQLMFLLPDRVGSPLSLNSLREDLEVHFATVKHWMDLLERVFYGFFLRPFAKKTGRMLKKEAKWYLWDWTEVDDAAARFENIVAVHLRKYVDYINDLGLGSLSLHYVRDKEKREVDFLVCEARKPLLLVECKMSDMQPAQQLVQFGKLLGVKRAIQVVATGGGSASRVIDGITTDVISAPSLLGSLV